MEELAENDEERLFLQQIVSSLEQDLPEDLLKQVLRHHLHRKRYADEVKKEKQVFDEYLRTIGSQFQPKHAELYRFENWPINQNLLEMLKQNSCDPEIIKDINSSGLYTFSLLPEDFCRKFIDEIDYIEQWSEEHELKLHRPNSMNKYGVVLDHFGFDSCLNELMKTVVEPLSKIFYKHVLMPFDSHHGFIVEYAMNKDRKLNFHVDSSAVTLNLCLGTEFTAGELFFAGVRCMSHTSNSPYRTDEEIVLEHKIGTACLHLGNHRHQAYPITSGRRLNLILWCKSSSFEAEIQRSYHDCPHWCGENHQSQ